MFFSVEENEELLRVAFLRARSAMRGYKHVENVSYADISYLAEENPLLHIRPILYVNPDTKECLYEIKSLNGGSKFYVVDDYEAMFKQDRSAITLLLQNGLFEDNKSNLLFISRTERKARSKV